MRNSAGAGPVRAVAAALMALGPMLAAPPAGAGAAGAPGAPGAMPDAGEAALGVTLEYIQGTRDLHPEYTEAPLETAPEYTRDTLEPTPEYTEDTLETAPGGAQIAPSAAETAPPGSAEVPIYSPPGPRFFLALYGARWVDSDLPDMPGKLAGGTLEVDDAWLAGLAFTWRATPDIGLPWPGRDPGREGIALELEGQLIRHFGLQDHFETTAALVLRTPTWRPLGDFGVNLAWGNGLSWAFDDPAYEKGQTGLRGQETRRLQYHMSLELEFPPGDSRVRPFLRLHHRSGMYGVTSPQETGSNYLGVGLRFALD